MKRKSKGLALLLALMMLISMNPAIVFAEDIAQGGDPAPVSDESAVTPDDVYESLADATTSELEAAKEFFPSEETWDEVGAAANEVAAAKALSDAEEMVKAADEQTDQAADDAYASMEDAGKAKDNAKAANETAAASKEYAQGQQAIAEDPETSKTESEQAADMAGAAAGIAEISAGYAARYAKEASDAAAKAQASYEEAQAIYEAAEKEVNKKLEQGLINAQEAADLTKAAKEKADAAYNEWQTKKQLADEAVFFAKERAEAANEELEEQIRNLDEVIESTAKDVADKTGTAVVTGSALAAAKAALGASKVEITYYEGRIDIEEAKISELNEKIADAEAKIEAADAVLQVKKAALDTASDDYDAKVKELEEAEEQLDLARAAVESVKDIIEERDESGIKAQLSAVRDGECQVTDIHDVAEYLMDNDPKIEWDAVESNIFKIGDKFYSVYVENILDDEGVVIDHVLRVFEYFPGEYEEVTELPDPAEAWAGGDEPGVQPTDMTASNEIGEGEVQLRMIENGELRFFRYEVVFKGNTYELQKDDKGFYIINKKGKRFDVTVEAPKEGDEVTNTERIAAEWDDATAKENEYTASKAAVKGAVSARNIAALVLGKANIEYKVADINLQYQGAKKAVYNWRKAKHVNDLIDLDNSLNYNDWTPTEKQSEEINDATKAIAEVYLGEPITFSRVKAVGKALLDFSMPAKFRGDLIDKIIHPVTKEVHHKAVEELKTSVKDGSEAVSTAATATAKAGVEAVDANVDLAGAVINKAYVDKKAKDAEAKKAAADQAAIDAAIALEDYERLAEAYGPSGANVYKARLAAEEAQRLANLAADQADAAQTEAADALTAYEAAKAAADAKNDPSPSPSPTPGGNPSVDPQVNPQGGQTAVSGSGYAAGSSTGKTNTGDHSKTLVWLTTLCTAGLALTKGLLSRLGTQN